MCLTVIHCNKTNHVIDKRKQKKNKKRTKKTYITFKYHCCILKGKGDQSQEIARFVRLILFGPIGSLASVSSQSFL